MTASGKGLFENMALYDDFIDVLVFDLIYL